MLLDREVNIVPKTSITNSPADKPQLSASDIHIQQKRPISDLT